MACESMTLLCRDGLWTLNRAVLNMAGLTNSLPLSRPGPPLRFHQVGQNIVDTGEVAFAFFHLSQSRTWGSRRGFAVYFRSKKQTGGDSGA